MSEGRLDTYGYFMTDVAIKSGEIIREGFFNPIKRGIKDDLTPVAQTDLDVNAYVSSRIASEFPKHGFLGEEGDIRRASGEHLWICDPLDGTRPVLNGIPLGAFSLSLALESEVICSVIHDPFMDRTVYAAKNEGAWSDGIRLRASSQPNLVGANVHTCWGEIESGYLTRLDRLRRFGAKVIKMDATVYAGMLVAQGRLDADIYTGNQPWDVVSQSLAVEEAGGVATTLSGNKLTFTGEKVDGAVISNRHLNEALVELINDKKL